MESEGVLVSGDVHLRAWRHANLASHSQRDSKLLPSC
jgi:hypothetical protein